jgi:hypothetical protein
MSISFIYRFCVRLLMAWDFNGGMLIHYQLVHLVSFLIAKRGKVSAPKAKSRSNWGFRFRRMTSKSAEAGTRPPPGA